MDKKDIKKCISKSGVSIDVETLEEHLDKRDRVEELFLSDIEEESRKTD